jgi:hypothetical protein
VLLDAAELPPGDTLRFTLNRVPYSLRRGPATRVRTLVAQRWIEHPRARFDPQGVEAVEIEVSVGDA